MAYELYPHPDDVQEQIEAVPEYAGQDFNAALTTILSDPWAARPWVEGAPRGLRLRTFGLGYGLILFSVRFDDKVQVEQVTWLGP